MAVEVRIERATIAHAQELAAVMREPDAAEVMAATGETPIQALERGLDASELCGTVRFNGEVGVMFGLARSSQYHALVYRPDNAWFLTGEAAGRNPLAFIRTMKSITQQMLQLSPALYNWVDDRYVGAKWLLRQLGVQLSEPVQFGINGELFRLGVRRR